MEPPKTDWMESRQQQAESFREQLKRSDPILTLLSDPLSQPTRRARRFLIGVSALAIAFVYTGLVPEQISALGIKFSEADHVRFFVGLIIVIAYALVIFFIYGRADLLSANHLLDRAEFFFAEDFDTHEYAATAFQTGIMRNPGGQIDKTENVKDLFKRTRTTFKVRRVLEFWFPIGLGTLAIVYTLFHVLS